MDCVICSQRGLESLEPHSDVIARRSIPCYSASEEVISYLSTTVTPQGIIAVVPMIHLELEEMLEVSPPVLLVANRVRDPGNLGNIIRTSDAAGIGGMVVCRESADLYNPKTVRSTAGSVFHLPVCVGVQISEVVRVLRGGGYSILVADPHRGTDAWEYEWPPRLALIVGNEAWGVPEDEGAMADGAVRVPIYGRSESINVSAAAAVLTYEVMRRRMKTNNGEDG